MEFQNDEKVQLIRQKEIENGRLLIERSSHGDVDGVKELLSSGVQPSADAYIRTLYYESKNYWSPLHHAASGGHREITELLIEDGGVFVEIITYQFRTGGTILVYGTNPFQYN